MNAGILLGAMNVDAHVRVQHTYEETPLVLVHMNAAHTSVAMEYLRGVLGEFGLLFSSKIIHYGNGLRFHSEITVAKPKAVVLLGEFVSGLVMGMPSSEIYPLLGRTRFAFRSHPGTAFFPSPSPEEAFADANAAARMMMMFDAIVKTDTAYFGIPRILE